MTGQIVGLDLPAALAVSDVLGYTSPVLVEFLAVIEDGMMAAEAERAGMAPPEGA